MNYPIVQLSNIPLISDGNLTDIHDDLESALELVAERWEGKKCELNWTEDGKAWFFPNQSYAKAFIKVVGAIFRRKFGAKIITDYEYKGTSRPRYKKGEFEEFKI